MTTSDVDLLTDTLTKTGAIIAGVTPEQLGWPTPCADFTVRQLINHLVGWASSFASRLNSEPSDADPNAYEAGADPAGEFNRAANQIVGAYRAQLEPARELPVGILLMEYVTHGWDLATASGQEPPFTDAEAKAGLAVGKSMLKPESRGPGKSFGEEFPATASDDSVEQLAAFLGRDPHWKASA